MVLRFHTVRSGLLFLTASLARVVIIDEWVTLLAWARGGELTTQYIVDKN
jgi:hypothetical protein